LLSARPSIHNASCRTDGAAPVAVRTSGELPILAPPLRLGELVATLALAQDNAFGQPLESQLRSCLLAMWMCEAAGVEKEACETTYWVALLRYIGCTGHAHEVATVFGDEIAIRAQTLVHDAANPAEVMRDVVAFATAGRTQDERDEIIRMIQQTAQEWAVYNFSSGCEVADMLVQRLDFGPSVREALAFTFERWNGNGYPAHARGEAIPLAMRVVHLSHDMEAIGRIFSPDHETTPSIAHAIGATARMTRPSPICSSRTGEAGSIGSARLSPGTRYSPSSLNPSACWMARPSTMPSPSRPTLSI
jgi:hypothetical protein